MTDTKASERGEGCAGAASSSALLLDGLLGSDWLDHVAVSIAECLVRQQPRMTWEDRSEQIANHVRVTLLCPIEMKGVEGKGQTALEMLK